jgi:hypothetical protein
MDPTGSLAEVERRAYRSVSSDGITDIQFALLFLVFASIPILEWFGVSRFYGYALLVLPIVVPWLARRYVTIPRMGRVQFGPARRSRTRLARFAAAIVLLLTLPVVILIATQSIAGGTGWMLIAIMAAPVLLLAVYVSDIPRNYAYTALVVFSVVESEFLLRHLEQPIVGLISFGLPGAVLLGIGSTRFVGFLRTHRLPAEGDGHAR